MLWKDGGESVGNISHLVQAGKENLHCIAMAFVYMHGTGWARALVSYSLMYHDIYQSTTRSTLRPFSGLLACSCGHLR